MTQDIIPYIRLRTQRLVGTLFTTPAEVVGWLGAVQAQDYAGAKWALGMRLAGLKEQDIDDAFNRGDILRTHVMRPTWHFVTPRDIWWMLKLTAPRVLSVSAYYMRKLELDAATIVRCNTILANALKGERYLTRADLVTVLQDNGVRTIGRDNNLRFTYIMMHAELDGVICSGPRIGRQFTYALFDERAPQAIQLSREESLSELTNRYFSSHGPALVKDFTWWSGLTVADAKVGIELMKNDLLHETINGNTYWYANNTPASRPVPALLLSNYDEYTVAYRDHDAVFDPVYKNKLETRFPHSILVDGQVIGSWKREFKRDEVVVTTKLFVPTTADVGVQAAADAYGRFLGKQVTVLRG